MPCLHQACCGFEAARSLPLTNGTNQRHGHSFRLHARADMPLPDLREQLARIAAPLNYADLDHYLGHADYQSLLEWLASQLPTPAALSLRSAPGLESELDPDGQRRICISGHFDAAHWLPHVPDGHQCGRLHGHGFGVRLVADAGQHDAAALYSAWQPLHATLHHRLLNDIAGLSNPTSEMLACWIWQQLQPSLSGLQAVEVFETASAGSRYDGQGFRIWKEQRFEAAVPFDHAGRYTGHSYLVRLVLTGIMSDHTGWVRDFGEIKARFKPVYAQLDHHPLDHLPAIDATDCAGIARWIAREFAESVPELCRIDLLENSDEGAVLFLPAAKGQQP